MFSALWAFSRHALVPFLFRDFSQFIIDTGKSSTHGFSQLSRRHCLHSFIRAVTAHGFFFHGIGKPGITAFRNTIVAAHRAHLQQRDASNCLSRGYLTDAGGREWLGSAMVYEFENRAALDDFFRDEPYCTNGIYQRIDIYDWQRGVMA